MERKQQFLSGFCAPCIRLLRNSFEFFYADIQFCFGTVQAEENKTLILSISTQCLQLYNLQCTMYSVQLSVYTVSTLCYCLWHKIGSFTFSLSPCWNLAFCQCCSIKCTGCDLLSHTLGILSINFEESNQMLKKPQKNLPYDSVHESHLWQYNPHLKYRCINYINVNKQ